MAQRSIAETRVAAIEINKRGYLYAHTTANHQWVENPKDEYAAEAMTPGACVVNLSYLGRLHSQLPAGGQRPAALPLGALKQSPKPHSHRLKRTTGHSTPGVPWIFARRRTSWPQ